MTLPNAYVMQPRLGGGTCGGCGRRLYTGEIAVYTLIDTRHLGCSTPAEVAAAVCPDCDGDHKPTDGGCLL